MDKVESKDWAATVEEILNEVRPALHEHGGDATLVGVEEKKVKIKLQGSCHGCPMSVMTFGIMVDDMIKRRLPEVQEIVYE